MDGRTGKRSVAELLVLGYLQLQLPAMASSARPRLAGIVHENRLVFFFGLTFFA